MAQRELVKMNAAVFDKPHLLVVDEDQHSRNTCTDILQAEGFRCSSAANGEEALSILARTGVDLVLTDMVMPGLNGLDLIERIKESTDSDVIAFTGSVKDYDFPTVFQKGAIDFMLKPVRRVELLARVKRVLRERTLCRERNAACRQLEANNQQLLIYAEDLNRACSHLEGANQQLLKYAEDLNRNFEQLRSVLQDLQHAYLETIHRLVIAAEFKDEDTAEHITRMSRYCSVLAEKLGLPKKDIENIRYASPMHDVGKIGIPDSILMKPGKLTQDEMTIMKRHAAIGENILSNSKADVIKMAAQIALTHHEKWNGDGYPLGLAGAKIPLCGRIAAVADVFDALGSERPYKEALPLDKTMEIMKEGRGTHFDPDILDVLTNNIDDFARIKANKTRDFDNFGKA